MSSKVSPSEKSPHDKKEDQNHIVGPYTFFKENCKGLKLHCSYWKPKNKPIKGLVFLCHGFGEHLLWYEDLALRLVSCGIFAFGHDHVGHGKSEGIRGHVANATEYITDVMNHCEQVKKEYKGLPCFIVGHSMGGMISIRAAMTDSSIFDGVVLMGPLIRPNPEEATPFKIRVAKVLSNWMPLMSVGKLNLDLVTRDGEMLQLMTRDPLRYQGGFRSRWAMCCHYQCELIEKGMEEVTWPYLILHGSEDRLCSPDGSKVFHKNSRSNDKKLKIFPEAYHHLFLEIPEVRREALQDTVDWIANRLPKKITDEQENNSQLIQ